MRNVALTQIHVAYQPWAKYIKTFVGSRIISLYCKLNKIAFYHQKRLYQLSSKVPNELSLMMLGTARKVSKDRDFSGAYFPVWKRKNSVSGNFSHSEEVKKLKKNLLKLNEIWNRNKSDLRACQPIQKF